MEEVEFVDWEREEEGDLTSGKMFEGVGRVVGFEMTGKMECRSAPDVDGIGGARAGEVARSSEESVGVVGSSDGLRFVDGVLTRGK